MSDNNQTAVAAVTAAPALPSRLVTRIPVRSAVAGSFGALGFATPVLGAEWSLGVAGGSTVGAYAREISDRTADAMVGDLAGTTADKAGRRIVRTHNSTVRGRPRGCPV